MLKSRETKVTYRKRVECQQPLALHRATSYQIPLWLEAPGLTLHSRRIAAAAPHPDRLPTRQETQVLLEVLNDALNELKNLVDRTPDENLTYLAPAIDAADRSGTPHLSLITAHLSIPHHNLQALAPMVRSIAVEAATLAPYAPGHPGLELQVRRLQRHTLSTLRLMARLH